jgi:ATP-independent RNA helicase DbpA
LSSDFSDLSLLPELLSVLSELGYEKPTEIQARSLPLILAGEDVIGQSQTGSGKTTAFALPILQKIDLTHAQIQALILCPTRELVQQVGREVRTLGRRLDGLKVRWVVGGESVRTQAENLESGGHIIVGTPGRVLDLMQRGILDLAALRTLVLDEADKMLDMGFEAEMKDILDHLPGSYQSLFFSATLPEAILSLSQKYQKNPQHIQIRNQSSDQPQIEHVLYETEAQDKSSILMRVLQQHPAQAALVFCNQKATVDQLVEMMKAQDISCAALHGDLEQRDRSRVMALFQNGSCRILVATDIAARGLDVDHLDLVVNYDLPNQTETYVHRVGRTGRAGRKGVAITLAKGFDAIQIQEIEKAIGISFQRPVLGFKNQHGLSLSNRQAAMQTLSISGGRKDKIRPGDILGALTGAAGGFKAADIGKIEIQDSISFVAISSSLANAALQKLREGRIKGKKFQVKLVVAPKPKAD